MICKQCKKEFEGNFCSNCGASISDSSPNQTAETNSTSYSQTVNANIKPTKKKKGCLGIVLIVLVIIILITIFGSIGNDNDTPVSTTGTSTNSTSKPQSSEPKVQDIEISAVDLIKAYDENGVNADNLYKGKLLSVSGIITNIDKDIVDKVYITINDGDPFSFVAVQCYFEDKSEIEKVSKLKKGQDITVVGTCSGSSINVLLKKCNIK